MAEEFLTNKMLNDTCKWWKVYGMAAAEEVQFTLRVMMIKESNKVLYAEIDSDFADVLLSFLTLPLGTIVRLLVKHYGKNAPIFGSLNSLYAGLLNMDDRHFWTLEGLLMLAYPRNSSEMECSRLKLLIDDTPPTRYFMCSNMMCVSMYYNMNCRCSNSGNMMNRNDVAVGSQCGVKSVFTVPTALFILTDDMQILTNSPASVLRILKLNAIKDTNALEERTLIVGRNEIMELLKGSLVSKTPITDIILPMSSADDSDTLRETRKFFASAKCESDALPQTQTSQNISSDSKKITVKAFVQKSTNRILFAQTRHDFIDFILSLLTIPLGQVQFLLGSSTHLGSISNLYRSISDSENVEYMKSRDTIAKLLEPQIAPYYLSKYQIFSLSQQKLPVFHRTLVHNEIELCECSHSELCTSKITTFDPKGQDSYVKGPMLFIVTNDLEVCTAASKSIISILDQMRIPVFDVEEQELDIGMEEALSILKATLTSTSALTNGLQPFLKSRPKQQT
ncbi:uncharacterized protein [Primulina huaijiensis]|uniref:uncharacterized protein isoform X2 n=1 Tax=Primulina huaijiensis TaxID=1492673 RepID=UPI003CC6DF56